MTQEQARIGKLLKQITEALKRQANNDLRPQGITMSQMHVLMQLDGSDSKSISFKQLEANLDVAQSTIWGLVSRLEAKGLVEVLISSSDARMKQARITAAGELVCQNCRENIDKTERQLTSSLSEEETEQLVGLLKRVHQSIAE